MGTSQFATFLEMLTTPTDVGSMHGILMIGSCIRISFILASDKHNLMIGDGIRKRGQPSCPLLLTFVFGFGHMAAPLVRTGVELGALKEKK
ncbi:hypothetical protein GCM10011571_17060 [Marinithermofilum abyssi]|uniref:Uncharacterized protein n=1 Tax=Marinithermofilum abyssi TaxID=1571185 RepID=A0A8J2VBX5_9BACL|nr:hypothetical protein GCM10011571_17060 [Marinithermofilum abyssi]